MQVSGQLHAPAAILPLYRRLGGPQSRYGCGGEEKNSQPLPGLEPPIIQPVAQRYTAELTELLALKFQQSEWRVRGRSLGQQNT
jgi:hypothetical protein